MSWGREKSVLSLFKRLGEGCLVGKICHLQSQHLRAHVTTLPSAPHKHHATLPCMSLWASAPWSPSFILAHWKAHWLPLLMLMGPLHAQHRAWLAHTDAPKCLTSAIHHQI
jgi:hypothetical protein